LKTPVAYWDAIARTPTLRRVRWANPDQLVAGLREINVTSNADLIKAVPQLSVQQRLMAIRLLGILRLRSAGPLLVACWLSDDAAIRWEAKIALESVKSRQAYQQLLHIIRHHSDMARREEACYILYNSNDDILFEPLMEIYTDKSLPSSVRAQAAEGLGSLLTYVDRRTRRYRQALIPLLNGLRDPSPEIRFWTCYALGQMRAKDAQADLQRVMEEDEALCPGWWYVKDEASDAINHILNKPVPDRERVSECR
jgi:HEAT repeat protein